MRRLSLGSRLALLFAACTAVVSLIAGLLFSRASESHFLELDQQLLDSKLVALRSALQGAEDPGLFAERSAILRDEMNHQTDLALRVRGHDGSLWFDSASQLSADLPTSPGLHSLQRADIAYRVYSAPLDPERNDSPQLTLLLDITHHQHFLQRMQHLIWLTVGLSALATALLGAWADTHAGKKRLLAWTTLGCVLGTVGLALAGPGAVVLALAFVVLSNFCFGSGENLIAAFLPELAKGSALGKVSGWG